MSDPELAESSAKKFTHPRSARDVYGAAVGVVALLGAFSYFAFARAPQKPNGASGGAVRVERVHSFGNAARAEACAPSGTPCEKLVNGSSIPAGSHLRTDFQTELALSLGDKGHLILARGSELELLGASKGTARLRRGSLFGELEDTRGTFELELPHGTLSATRAKFAAHAESDASRVEVSRGNVRVENTDGHASPVHAGEVARFSKTRFDVEPGQVLGSALAFDDDADSPRAERQTRGLGELSARKPGSREELGGAVHLVSHAVK
ncbi:MAG TPA: FecR domain-containing protein, partial [Polyangiaceae bacterium]|nr:FecR domain-containing protein [Polyangiaceae bacterium]